VIGGWWSVDVWSVDVWWMVGVRLMVDDDVISE
jgi:hypothetical protein